MGPCAGSVSSHCALGPRGVRGGEAPPAQPPPARPQTRTEGQALHLLGPGGGDFCFLGGGGGRMWLSNDHRIAGHLEVRVLGAEAGPK